MKEIQLEEMWGKINKALTSENKTFLESKTAKILPNNPTSQGFSADQIRKSLYEGILVLFEWLKTTNNSNVDFNNKVMETLTAITENNEEDKQDLANLKQALIDGTFNVKYLTWAIMATNDENGNRIIDTYATIERLTQVLEALTQEISDRKAADDLEKNERKEETSAIINSVNQEISDRTNAVSVLNNLITAETENRASEDEKVLQYAQSVNEALGNAKTDLQGKIDSEAQTRLTNDNEIKASITSKEDGLKALINSVKNELNGSITTLSNRVNNLPTNYVFDTYESMTNDLLNASNTKYKVGDTLFIKEVNKPDYWVSAILSTKGIYGYYELSEQESKVDLSNYVKISELSREAIEEKFLETVENGTKSFTARSFTATNKNSGIDVNNYTQYGYDGVSFHKNGVQYPITFPEKDGVFALTSDIPQALKNPFALTINGKVYDGSSAVSITTETITEHDFVRFWHAGIEIQNDGSEHVLRLSDFDTELEEFSPHISCQYDGPQYYWVWKFPQISGTFAMESQIPTKLSQLKNDGNYQTNTSDLKDNTTTFTTASSRSNVASGEKLSVSFGKIAKYFNDLKAIAFSGDRADIGLGNVDNTSDANKPVSTATQQALNLKANASDVYTKSESDTGLNKSLYNLGAYDTISGNVITRQTGYVDLGSLSWSEVDTNCWKSSVSNFPNIYTSGKVIVGEKYKSASINDYAGFIALGVGYIGMLSTYEYIICMSNGKPTGLAQYKLATSYTEEIIEGQPLITLDSQGSQWLRSEWEKGLNVWDEQWEVGSIDSSTGNNMTATNRIRTKNYIKVSTYTLYITIENFSNVFCYNNNKSFLGVATYTKKGVGYVLYLKNNTSYIRFNTNTTYGATYKNDIAIYEGDHPYPYQAYNGEIVHDKDIADLYKQEYNLGYYDTMVENSDGTYTITRQTGYLVLDGVENKFIDINSVTTNRIFYNENIQLYVEKPSSTNIVGNIICNRFGTTSFDYLYFNNAYGISLDNTGSIGVGLTTAITTIDEANAWLIQNPIYIQYKLATATTEKVEKNHYARYNQDFILDHNKSEAERSSNLFDINDIGYDSGGYRYFIIRNSTNGKYTFSSTYTSDNGRIEIFKWSGSGSPVVLSPQISIHNINNVTFETNEIDNTYKYLVFYLSVDGNYSFDFSSYNVMLNKGSTPLPYQPYEGKVVHEKELGEKLGSYVDVSSTQVITGEKRFSFIGIDLIKSSTTGDALFTQNQSTGDVSLGAVGRNLHFVGNQDRPRYSKDGGVNYSEIALMSDIPTPGIFSLVGNNVDTLTISKNETYFIVSVAVNPIYVEGNTGISFIGSSLVTTVGMLSGDPKICINGSAYSLDNNSVTLKTTGLMKVYKVNY